MSPAWTVLSRAAASWWIRLLISAAILAYLATQIDMAAATRAVIAIKLPHLALVLALVAIDRMVMVLRWVLLLRASHVPITTRAAASIFLVSSFVGSFLPAGVGGDAARAYGLSRLTTGRAEAIGSVVVDRVLGILSLASMAVIGASIFPTFLQVDTSRAAAVRQWQTLAAILIVVLVSATVFWSDRVARAIIPAAFQNARVARYALGAADAISRFRGRRGVLLHVMAWSLIVQVLRIVQAYFLGAGLGLTVPLAYYFVFMPIGLLMLLLPISVSGFGLPQGVIVWLLAPVGVAEEQAFALSTLIVLTGLAGNLPGLVIWLRERREIL